MYSDFLIARFTYKYNKVDICCAKEKVQKSKDFKSDEPEKQ